MTPQEIIEFRPRLPVDIRGVTEHNQQLRDGLAERVQDLAAARAAKPRPQGPP